MATDELDMDNAPETEPNSGEVDEQLPIGIARIRQEWCRSGFAESGQPEQEQQDIEPVVFTEVDGGAGIGDYVLDRKTVKDMIALSDEAVDRLIKSGELDSILVATTDAEPRRMTSESSVRRFQSDSEIDPEAVERAAKAMVDASVSESIQMLQSEIEQLHDTQGKVLAQMKDMLLLEVRNLKEQDRDLASFVYELAEEIRNLLPKKRRK
ncbi:unnamed protein product [marine sediment metagenome]|uniref:Uncharacterized protein n=1 Tax=marine sediment metagenome TaxID=412755 RepID=X0YYT8_9ZZZZ